jgi:hypothetical protein
VGCNSQVHRSNACRPIPIPLYRYLYVKLGKNTMSFLLSPRISLQQNRRTRGRNRFCLEAGAGPRGGTNNVYTLSICKNNKKGGKKKQILIV